MEVDGDSGEPGDSGIWADYNRNEPPVDMDWDNWEVFFRYLKARRRTTSKEGETAVHVH